MRPRLDEQERRARTVGVRVTAAEEAELRERAQAARLSMGAYGNQILKNSGNHLRRPCSGLRQRCPTSDTREARVGRTDRPAPRARRGLGSCEPPRSPARHLRLKVVYGVPFRGEKSLKGPYESLGGCRLYLKLGGCGGWS